MRAKYVLANEPAMLYVIDTPYKVYHCASMTAVRLVMERDFPVWNIDPWRREKKFVGYTNTLKNSEITLRVEALETTQCEAVGRKKTTATKEITVEDSEQ